MLLRTARLYLTLRAGSRIADRASQDQGWSRVVPRVLREAGSVLRKQRGQGREARTQFINGHLASLMYCDYAPQVAISRRAAPRGRRCMQRLGERAESSSWLSFRPQFVMAASSRRRCYVISAASRAMAARRDLPQERGPGVRANRNTTAASIAPGIAESLDRVVRLPADTRVRVDEGFR